MIRLFPLRVVFALAQPVSARLRAQGAVSVVNTIGVVDWWCVGCLRYLQPWEVAHQSQEISHE